MASTVTPHPHYPPPPCVGCTPRFISSGHENSPKQLYRAQCIADQQDIFCANMTGGESGDRGAKISSAVLRGSVRTGLPDARDVGPKFVKFVQEMTDVAMRVGIWEKGHSCSMFDDPGRFVTLCQVSAQFYNSEGHRKSNTPRQNGPNVTTVLAQSHRACGC